MTYGTVNVDSVVNSDGVTSGGLYGFKNRIINGAMGIWQRGTSFSVSTTTVTYTADRFGIYQPSGTGTITQDTDVPTGFQYSLKAVGAGTDLVQRIESKNAFDLSGQSVTVSFWIKQTVGAGSGSMTVALQYANSADNFSALTSISSQTLTPTSSWARYSLTFTSMPSGVANGMSIDIYPTSGGSSSTYFITGVQLEKGSTATSFDYRPYGTELALCQRYYEKSYATSTAVGTNTAVGTITLSGTSDGNSNFNCPLKYQVEKRDIPTVTAYTSAGTSGNWSYTRSGVGQTNVVTTAYQPSTSSTTFYGGVGATWVAVQVGGHYIISSEL